MTELLGLTTLAIISLITLTIALRWPGISNILFVGLAIRIFFLLTGHYIVSLPDSTADAVTFENVAWYLGKDGFLNVLNYYNGPNSRFISWVIAIPYSLFGRSLLMAKSISLLFGIGSIFLGWKVAKIIWNERIANKVGWAIALFPSLILYSVLVMREVYVCFFVLVALYGVVKWVKTDDFKSIILAIIGFVGATFFHGALFVGILIFIAIVTISNLKKLFKKYSNFRISLKNIIFLIFIFVSSGYYLSNKIQIPYLGTFDKATDLNYLIRKTNVSTRGNASWPEWTIPKSSIEIIYKAPVRAMYIVFSPFPWDIKETKHLIGMFDSFIFMYLTFLIFSNIKTIWNDPSLRIILILLLFYLLVFGIGVGNFGTGIRHRSKFAVMFILLAAPLIKKFIFFKKKNLTK
jgi:hypothetical protein